MTPPSGEGLVLRPTLLARVVGWCVAGLGLVLVASGLTAPDDREILLTMVLAGIAFVAVGLTLATAAAYVDGDGIRYRNGLQRRAMRSDSITGVTVGPGSGAPPPRLAYVIHRVHGRPVRLIGVQQWRSDSATQTMAATARAMENLLGLPGH